MRADDLDLERLLDFSPDGGMIRFAGERAIILDAVALGLLRAELISTAGTKVARGVLTRFGYAHGWRTAESLKGAFPWDSDGEWRTAGGRIHELQGQVTVEPSEREGLPGAPFAETVWRDSYEAEQHLLHLGRSDEAVCWTLAGFASGYLSFVNGREFYCLEDRCRGKGDELCHMVGRPRDEWGPEATEQLGFFETAGCDEVLRGVTDALRKTERRLKRRLEQLARAGGGDDLDPSGIVARSPEMRHILDLARRLAKVDATVLVTGESGAGKERVSRLIHDESARAAGPFVAVNCGAVAEGLLESELFGHVRGAFTGASQDRAGLFEEANKGTLFLDEIGEVTPAMQVKLLRVLQEREVRRVGDSKSRKVDVRVIAATNRDLAKDVISGRFRQDLYYRLRVVELRVPPLRERRDDILPLARVLLEAAARRMDRKIARIAPEAAERMLGYAWPGNVRELGNAIERAVALAEGTRIEATDLPEEVRAAELDVALPVAGRIRKLNDVEKDYILAALKANGGKRVETAKDLGIGIATLNRKLKLYRG